MSTLDELLLDIEILCAQAQLNQLKIMKKMYKSGQLKQIYPTDDNHEEDNDEKIWKLMTLPTTTSKNIHQ